MKNTTIKKTSDFGKGLKKLGTLFWVACMLSASAVFAQTGTISIGSGTANSANRVPIYSCYNYSYSQQIVKASEFATAQGLAGPLTKIRYYYASGGTTITNWNNWTVYLGHTAKTAFASDTDWEPLANLTQVFSGTITPVAGNWFEITFTTPFNYNGTSNLIVAVDENSSGYSCTAAFGSYTGATDTGLYYYSDDTNPNPASPPSGTRTSTLARVQFEGTFNSCVTPTGLAFSDVTTNTATISWGASATAANGYEYYYSTTNTTPTAATVASGSTAAGVTSASISVMPNTQYYFWVRGLCNGSSVSGWSLSKTFTTLCDAVDIPYMEDVESASTPAVPECIVLQNSGNGNNWSTATINNYGFSSKVFRYLYNSTNPANAWFYTRGLNLTAGVSYRLGYTYGNDSSIYTEKLKIAYGTGSNAASMTTILADYPTVTGATATTTFVDFVPATTGVYYIGFNAYSAANQNRLFVDDISVIETPNCEPLTTLTAEAASFTSATISYEESASIPANGYEYYISETDTAPTDATPASGTIAAGVLETTVSNLTENTTYYVWVRAVCSASESSSWYGPVGFFTGYCTPAPTSIDGDGIVGVELGTINNVTSAEAGNYADYSAMVATFPIGATVDFAITYNTGFTYGTKIWVDWNNDTDFDDEGELVYTGLSTNDEPTTLEGSFAIPEGVSEGLHRIRIGGTDNNNGPSSPCYTSAYGSFEDYTLDLYMPDAPVITGFTPASYCAVDGVITITGTALAFATLEIGDEAIDITSNSDTEIVATVPAGISGTVSVTTAGGVGGTFTTTDEFAVTEPAELVLSATESAICIGDNVSLTITEGLSDFDTFVWTPATGVTGNATDGFVFSPSETTEYVLTASQSAGPCEITTDYTVTVNPLPTEVTVTPASVTACLGSPVELTGTGGEYEKNLDYCTPTVSSTGATGDYIRNFSFADITNNDSGDTESDYLYYDNMTANVVGGQTYDISVQAGPSWGQRFRVWIDFNQDGVFSADESVFATATSTLDAVTGTVTIPVTAFNGVTRMRVGSRFGSTGITAAQACGHTGFGEWEDYNIIISGATSGTEFVWTPAEGLYTDPAGTTPYSGELAKTVYAMPMAATTYTATVTTDFGCTASASTTIDVIVTPAPTGNTDVVFETTATVAELMATGENIQWYDVETGGTPLSDDTELHSGMYYATQTVDGCESQTRLAVMVTIPEMDWVNLQWPPELTIVEGTMGTVYAQGYEEGVTPGAGPGIGVTAWIGVSSEDTDPSTWTMWVPATFNTQVGNNDEFMAEIGDGLEPGTYYYASRFQYLAGPYTYGGYSATGGGFWDGATNVSGVLTVNCGTQAPMADASQAFCDAATVADLMAEGTGILWYATPTGGDALASDAEVLNGGTYYASQTVDCESLTRTAVTVTINVTAAPTGEANQTFEDGATVADLMAMGNDVMWYDAEDGMMLDAATPLVDGTTYYATQTTNGCESQEYFAVTVTVNDPALDWVNLQYPSESVIVAGETTMVYAQAYEPGVTPGTGPGAGITAWIGVSSEDTDPSTWTTWVPATFNIQVGNNDEYVAQIGVGLAPGTYYYASRFMLQDGPYTYGGYSTTGGGIWNGTTNVSGVLTVLCGTEAPMADMMQTFCNSATVADLMASGTDVQWYMDETGGVALSMDMPLTDGATYYASQVTDGCESIGRTEVMVTVNVVAAPTGEAQQVVMYTGEGATVGDIVVEGDGVVTWYATEDDAIAMENSLDMDTVVEVGATYYATLTSGDCTSAEAFAVTVTDVALGTGHFDVASFSYYPNPVKDVFNMSYSADITSVEVFNLVGQKVMVTKPNTMNAQIDMSTLSDGTYIVNVTAGNAVKTIKVIKRQ